MSASARTVPVLPLVVLGLALLALPVLAASAAAAGPAEWHPAAYADQDTLEMRTVSAGEAPHWFKVWLVVLDGQVYVRLGSRAAKRIENNTTAPFIAVKIAGQEFDRVKADAAPEQAEAVAAAMADKYWSDALVHFFPHPLTLRLVPAPAENAPAP